MIDRLSLFYDIYLRQIAVENKAQNNQTAIVPKKAHSLSPPFLNIGNAHFRIRQLYGQILAPHQRPPHQSHLRIPKLLLFLFCSVSRCAVLGWASQSCCQYRYELLP